LAVGVPVVAADCPGALREVQAYCREMILVPPEAPAALADAIVSACTRFKSARPREDLSHFDLQRVVGEYSRLLEN
jgi:glycosyltransferase involved in cell wall biosynthesis